MGDTRLDHVALAVWRWSDARATLVDKLGGRWMGGVRMPEYNPCQLAFANGMRVELLEPGTDDSSFLARFLARSGAGPHHVTFKVDDIRVAIRRARDAGLQIVRERLDNPAWQEAFLHPRSTGVGFVIQLAQSDIAPGAAMASAPGAVSAAEAGLSPTAVAETAARIDRLPLGSTLFLLGAIMQITWGLVVALDLVFARIYPFIWQPKGEITSFEFDLMLVFNTGVGILIGEYGLGLIADKFGRRPVLVLSALFAGGFIWEIAFSNSFWPLLAWNTLYAIGVGGALSVVNTYMHEIAPISARGQLALRTQLIALLLSAVIGSVPAFFWIPEHYQWVLFLDAALPLLIVIPLVMIFVPESPRWLASKGRFDQADRTVKKWEVKASRAGRLPEPQAVEATVTDKVPTRELFTGTYGKRTILLAVVWFLAYGGMIYGQGSYLSLFLVGTDHFTAHQLFAEGLVAGLVGAAVFLVFSNIGERVERKTIIVAGCVVYLIGGCLLPVTHGVTGPFILAIIMTLGEYIFFMNLYSYTALSYPTRLRSAGTGWTDGVGHCGSALSPLVAGPLFTATAASMNYGWFIWILLPGTFIPGVLIAIFGNRQSGRALELLAE